MENKNIRVLISGGGTGGHIFPAVSIANAIKQQYPTSEILFVGANGRMEMDKVPAAGYKIVGLPIQGLYRSLTPKNFTVLKNLFKSLSMAKKIIEDFKPDIAIGTGRGNLRIPLGFLNDLADRAATRHTPVEKQGD